MVESLDQFVTSFNRSIRVECREDRLTGDAGAIPIREVMDRTGVTRELASRLLDPRDSARVRYSLETLLRERVSLLCQGWFDQDDADRLRRDPAFRASVCSGKGAGVLAEDQSLASQPTMSRLMGMMKTEENLEVLNEVLLGYGMRRILSERGSRRLRRMVIDLDGLPVEAHGNQSGSEWNGHYRQRMFHSLVASSGEHGDLLGGIVRRGACSSADGSPDFVNWLCERLIGKSCRSVLFRIDAGFSGDTVLSVIEDRRQSHVSRLVDNAVLARMARPYLRRPPGRPPRGTRIRLYEDRYRAGSWKQARRVVLVVLDKPGELISRYFWLVTNLPRREWPAEKLLNLYRTRGKAEKHMGELMTVLSSAPRSGKEAPSDPEKQNRVDPANQALFLLHLLAYQVLHVGRRLMERSTRRGWSIRRFRERVLKVPARVVTHGRRITFVISRDMADDWNRFLSLLPRLDWECG